MKTTGGAGCGNHLTKSTEVYFQISGKPYFGISVSNSVFQHTWKQPNFTLSYQNILLFSYTNNHPPEVKGGLEIH